MRRERAFGRGEKPGGDNNGGGELDWCFIGMNELSQWKSLLHPINGCCCGLGVKCLLLPSVF